MFALHNVEYSVNINIWLPKEEKAVNKRGGLNVAIAYLKTREEKEEMETRRKKKR